MTASSADDSRAQDQIIVDANGVMRWEGTNEEVHLFGVNYTTPFSSAYQYHKKLGVSIKQAIDLDVAQMARLGFDGFRLHVWDVEISNSSGNLLDNEHLDLLDYLLARLAEHGIKSILTPLVWYSSSEQSVTMGFCQFHPKREAITDENARKAERTYLAQFVQHTNPYRKIAYKDDPSIVALEIFNEPDHPEDPQATIGYINEMAKVLRTAGFAKPLFYNIAEVWSEMQEANVSTQACVDGFSFQWYPTSLVFRKMHHGNHLMNVSRYAIPAADDPGALSKAKIVYEFDAADIGGSYMYPAMVRGFREAGMQFAAMFTYDPSQLAWGNIEFPTHFMNLLYTPSKAISLMIAGKAFRGLPRLVDHGGYPDNSRFGDFRVSYEEDLSELNSATEFLYSNRTQSQPTNPHRLQRVSGCGCSPLVEYDGTGAYFLDKLEPGIWRLELYPDVLWLDDPFGATGMSRQVARLFWGQRRMTVSIPDLGDDYTTYPLGTASTGSRERATTRVGASEPIGRSLAPGVYLLAATTAGAEKIKPYLSSPQEPFLDGLYTPAPFGSGVYVVNRTNRYAIDSTELEFRFSIAAEREISRASLFVRRVGEGKFTKHPLEKCGGFDYVATDATAASRPGKLLYCITVETADSTAMGDPLVFPDGNAGVPSTSWWSYSVDRLWEVDVVSQQEDIVLLDASRDKEGFVFPHRTKTTSYQVAYTHGPTTQDIPLSLSVAFAGEETTPFGLQATLAAWVTPLRSLLKHTKCIVVRARAAPGVIGRRCIIGVNLLSKEGDCFGADVTLTESWSSISVPLSDLTRRSALLLPSAWPMFMPKQWKPARASGTGGFDIGALQAVQIVVDPANVARLGDERAIGFEILSVIAKR